jgi:mono/diheme cytochrome c family protein
MRSGALTLRTRSGALTLRTRSGALTLLLAFGPLSACSAGLPPPGSREAELARARWPDSSQEELNHGRNVYVRTCAGCHTLKSPRAVAPERWSDVVANMREKRGVVLSGPDARALVRYLWSASMASR